MRTRNVFTVAAEVDAIQTLQEQNVDVLEEAAATLLTTGFGVSTHIGDAREMPHAFDTWRALAGGVMHLCCAEHMFCCMTAYIPLNPYMKYAACGRMHEMANNTLSRSVSACLYVAVDAAPDADANAGMVHDSQRRFISMLYLVAVLWENTYGGIENVEDTCAQVHALACASMRRASWGRVHAVAVQTLLNTLSCHERTLPMAPLHHYMGCAVSHASACDPDWLCFAHYFALWSMIKTREAEDAIFSWGSTPWTREHMVRMTNRLLAHMATFKCANPQVHSRTASSSSICLCITETGSVHVCKLSVALLFAAYVAHCDAAGAACAGPGPRTDLVIPDVVWHIPLLEPALLAVVSPICIMGILCDLLPLPYYLSYLTLPRVRNADSLAIAHCAKVPPRLLCPAWNSQFHSASCTSAPSMPTCSLLSACLLARYPSPVPGHVLEDLHVEVFADLVRAHRRWSFPRAWWMHACIRGRCAVLDS